MENGKFYQGIKEYLFGCKPNAITDAYGGAFPGIVPIAIVGALVSIPFITLVLAGIAANEDYYKNKEQKTEQRIEKSNKLEKEISN